MIQAPGLNRAPVFRASAEPPKQSQDPAPLEVKPDLERIADRYNHSRSAGNYVSGMVLGAAKETVATTAQSPLVAASIIKNMWKAETIGPNLKLLGTLAAIPGAVLSIPVAPFYGAVEGASIVASHSGGRPLTKDTSGEYAKAVTQSQGNEPKTMSGRWMKSLDEFGNKKLEPGEKPYDVPILSPLFAITGGVVSGAISGVVGLVAGVVAGGITTGKEMVHAFTNKDESLGERVGQFLAAPLNLIVMGPALAWNGIKESVPRGLVDGWHHGPLKPVVDTAKISAGLAAGAIKEAWERK